MIPTNLDNLRSETTMKSFVSQNLFEIIIQPNRNIPLGDCQDLGRY